MGSKVGSLKNINRQSDSAMIFTKAPDISVFNSIIEHVLQMGGNMLLLFFISLRERKKKN